MDKMTSLERVLCALGHREADRVPVFLLLTMHGAKELGLTIEEYFSRPDYVAEGQLRMQARYGHDCFYAFYYAALECEAFGSATFFVEDGPPNVKEPFLTREKIDTLSVPSVVESKPLTRVLETIALLKEKSDGTIPIIGVVISPFSLPIMQMGFEAYLNLLWEDQERFHRLMAINEAFAFSWGQAQLDAGATALCYFDPFSSSSMIPRETFLQTGYPIACRMLKQWQAPVAIHMASGRCMPIVDKLLETGTGAIGVSVLEDLGQLKEACRHQATVFGNLNGLAMCNWTLQETEEAVRRALAQAAPGGGFILSDNHGEIPWYVSDDTLMTIMETVRKWGRYPINWIGTDEDGR
ncbi:uroporphyrinogen decarboxylase family protein [Heliorestis convoluta]|uniref:Uroporphyrinogen decarboxylase family protein n=1 Tax=Heliorestis convoluta TaxID=356322 RepID=A0A5Q2N4V8_9FIRM|nr:uroporphyrinogen decarboxylase family protein [Heliorestis convoluta]QGG47615.1 uroporphyrinogen decarboxylase family protein [Heliorestis convoluta]